MMFLCGVFVPLPQLPPVLRLLARILPLTYSVEALHTALLGQISWQIALDLGVLAAFSILLFALAVLILQRRLD